MQTRNNVKRMKINLVRKRIGKINMEGLVWFVGIKQNGITFFVADYDDDNNTVLWSGNKENGISFKTERAVHRFIHMHLNDRADIFLIQAPLA